MKKVLQLVDNNLAKVENFLIVFIFTIMVVFSFAQVVMRNLMNTGILWGDILLRHLVLWVGFLGASLATRKEKHIKIDILKRIVKEKYVPYIKIIIDSVAIIVCMILAKAGYVFLLMEKEANTILFENIPAWWLQTIIPVGFSLIAFRFFLKMLEYIINKISKE
jgi:C4-dicarboxylate transporter DctQ subunit